MPPSIKVFRDRVHGFVSIPRDTLLPLVDTPEFQRLRRLTQLGTSSATYPGGEHSRFQHSLGVAHLFQVVCAQFELNDMPLSDEQYLVGICAALLHDVGHGPFSHALEGVLVEGKHHETWTKEIVLSPETFVNKRLRELDASLPEKVADVIEKKSPHAILTSLISSQLDVDRMDYLLRDAECVGVPYGTYDADRLIKMLLRNHNQVVIDHRGLMNVEEYLFARYHMYWQVYFHPTTRGCECLLKAIWRRAGELNDKGQLTLDGLSSAVQAAFSRRPKHLSLSEYLALDNHDIYVALKVWRSHDDKILSDLCNRLLDRDLLKPVEIEGDQAWGKEGQVKEVLAKRGFDPDYYMLTTVPRMWRMTTTRSKREKAQSHLSWYLIEKADQTRSLGFHQRLRR